MIYNLTARAYLLIQDGGMSPCEAIIWVCRRLDKNLRAYYSREVSGLLALEGI